MGELATQKDGAAVRLRRPDRAQSVLLAQSPDDLVGAGHPVRLVQAVVEKLDLKRFHEPIKAREGQAGRDATDPELLVSLWLCPSAASVRRGSLRGARKTVRRFAGCAAG